MPNPGSIELPSAVVVKSAKDAAEILNIPSSDVKEATGAGFLSNATIDENLLPEDGRVKISSAIAVSEDITPGGALVVGTVTLPYNARSLGGEELEPFSERYYTVLKYFENGGWVDLKELEVVDFDITNKEVKLNAALVIIDGEPGNEPDVTYSFGSKKYGVKIVEEDGYKFLFVYDGVQNGAARDPILLKEDRPGSGPGSGGCDAGFGFGGLVLLGGAALIRRGKRR